MSPFWWGFLHPFGPPRPWWSKERRTQWFNENGTPWNSCQPLGGTTAEKPGETT